MNIKPGTLVMQIKSTAGNEGKVGTAIFHVGIKYFTHGVGAKDAWLIRFPAPVKTITGSLKQDCQVPTEWLRPVSGLPDEQHTEEHNKQEA